VADEEEFEEGEPYDLDKLFGEGEPSEFERLFGRKPPGRPDRESDQEPDERRVEEREVRVVGVYEHQEPGGAPSTPFVLLRDNKGRSVLIWIGRFEAWSISLALENAPPERPLTHDLIKNILDKTGWKVERVLIDDLFNETYYAKITVAKNGDVLEIDSRPSDAIAVGLRAKAPIYMAESVLQQAAVYEEF